MPLQFGRTAAKYRLSILDVDALHRAAEDEHDLAELFFIAGFAAGRAFERDQKEAL